MIPVTSRRWLAVPAVCAALALLGVLAAVANRPSPTRGPTPHHRSARGLRRAGKVPYHPTYITPARTATQERIDHALAASVDPSAMAQLEVLHVPAAHTSVAYPAVPARAETAADDFATAWVAELLDRNYQNQRRAQLLAWCQAEAAGFVFPGVPTTLRPRALIGSLLYPVADLGNPPYPFPTVSQWNARTASGETDQAAHLFASTTKTWNEIISAGWVPPDPLTTEVTVTGTLTERTRTASKTMQFSLMLTLGSALHHPGYGVSSAGTWVTADA